MRAELARGRRRRGRPRRHPRPAAEPPRPGRGDQRRHLRRPRRRRGRPHRARCTAPAVERIDDVGVAGLHRLLEARDRFADADCLVVVAGMEGALPSVVGGLSGVPLVAVPTSVGYGASFGGLAALLGDAELLRAGGHGGQHRQRLRRRRLRRARRPQRARSRRWLSAGGRRDRLGRRLLGRQRRHAARRPGRRSACPLGVMAEAVDKVAPGAGAARRGAACSRAGFAATRCHVEVADSEHAPHLARRRAAARRGRPARGRPLAGPRRLRPARRGRGRACTAADPRTSTSTRSAPWTPSPTSSASAPAWSTSALDAPGRRLGGVGGRWHGEHRARPPAGSAAGGGRAPPRRAELRRAGRPRAVHPHRRRAADHAGRRLGHPAGDGRHPRRRGRRRPRPRGARQRAAAAASGSRRSPSIGPTARAPRPGLAPCCSRPTSTTSTRGSGPR